MSGAVGSHIYLKCQATMSFRSCVNVERSASCCIVCTLGWHCRRCIITRRSDAGSGKPRWRRQILWSWCRQHDIGKVRHVHSVCFPVSLSLFVYFCCVAWCFRWTDYISNLFSLWNHWGDSWTLTSLLSRLGSRTPTVLWWLRWRHRCVPGQWQFGGGISRVVLYLPCHIGTAWPARHDNNRLKAWFMATCQIYIRPQ